MEPLITAAIAVASVIGSKALEKTGENVGNALWKKASDKFLVTLKKESPHTVTAIEKAPQQPLDYGKAVLDVESAVKSNPDVEKAAFELKEVSETNPPPDFTKILEEIKEALEKSQYSLSPNFIQNINKAINVSAGNQNIDLSGSTFNI